jgi:hypothetical protein
MCTSVCVCVCLCVCARACVQFKNSLSASGGLFHRADLETGHSTVIQGYQHAYPS